jgi:GT2 family glycosyltransferase
MILTIAFVVYNEEKHLDLLTANLQVFKNYSDRVQVLIIDNASSDESFKELQKLQSQFSFTLLQRTSNNMGAARADAVRIAVTPWLGFIDADCVVDTQWMDSSFSRLQTLSSRVVALGGPWVPAGQNKELFQCLFKTFFGHFNMPQIREGESELSVRHIPTAGVIYRRQSLLEAGSFNPERDRVGEDLDMSYRLLSRGGELLMVPELRFFHYLPASLSEWIQKIFSYGKARIQMAVHHNDLWAATYILPVLFFIFCAANLIFIESWHGLPFAAYLFTSLVMSLASEFSARGFLVFTYMVATHLAYSAGMARGAWSFVFEKFLRRKPLAPISHTPPSLEEI